MSELEGNDYKIPDHSMLELKLQLNGYVLFNNDSCDSEQNQFPNSLDIDDTSYNAMIIMSNDLLYILKRNEMLNIECNKEWSKIMELLLWSDRDINYIYNDNMFIFYIIQSNKKCIKENHFGTMKNFVAKR